MSIKYSCLRCVGPGDKKNRCVEYKNCPYSVMRIIEKRRLNKGLLI